MMRQSGTEKSRPRPISAPPSARIWAHRPLAAPVWASRAPRRVVVPRVQRSSRPCTASRPGPVGCSSAPSSDAGAVALIRTAPSSSLEELLHLVDERLLLRVGLLAAFAGQLLEQLALAVGQVGG